MNTRTMWKVFIVAWAIFQLSCTNWKAAYYKSQNDLDKCLRTVPEIITDIVEKKVIVNDTIHTISTLPSDTVIIKYRLTYDKKLQTTIEADSSIFYLTMLNNIRNDKLIQSIVVDSMYIHERTLTYIKTIKKEVVINHYRNGIIAGFAVALIFILLFTFAKRK